MAQYITNQGLKNTLQNFLDKLKSWLPFQKTTVDGEDAVVFPSKDSFKNILELQSNGKIYILGTNNEPEHLQASIEKRGTTFVNDVESAMMLLTDDNKGRFIYILQGTDEYPAGLYIVGIDASNGGKTTLLRIGTTTGVADLETRVVVLEQWKNNGMMDDENIMDIINPEN